VSLTVYRTPACDLASVIYAWGLLQNPSGPRRDEPVQVLHLAAVRGNKGVIYIGPRGCETWHRAAVVDRQSPGAGSD